MGQIKHLYKIGPNNNSFTTLTKNMFSQKAIFQFNWSNRWFESTAKILGVTDRVCERLTLKKWSKGENSYLRNSFFPAVPASSGTSLPPSPRVSPSLLFRMSGVKCSFKMNLKSSAVDDVTVRVLGRTPQESNCRIIIIYTYITGLEFHLWTCWKGKASFNLQRTLPLENLNVNGKLLKGT